MKINIEVSIIVCVACLVIGAILGAMLCGSGWRHWAVTNGVAYYNPTNAELTWKTNLVTNPEL